MSTKYDTDNIIWLHSSSGLTNYHIHKVKQVVDDYLLRLWVSVGVWASNEGVRVYVLFVFSWTRL